MATRTSVTSGNFSSGATWGGTAPVDGDSFIIATGHTVAVDSGISIPASGYDDSQINGILQHAASGTSTIRMNGVLTVNSGGTYHMRGDAVLEFTGLRTDNHGIRIADANAASFIAEGEDGMPSTTLSTGQSEGATSFTVASSTNFAAGEWIAIFDNTTSQTGNAGNTTLRDEGLWIHEISGNTIYIRQFVGPESTVVSGENNIIYVENAKIFRVGQKVIFGTSVNRNIHTITAINYGANQLTLSGDIVGIVAGLPIYETGSDKIHGTNNKVRKVATVTTVSQISTDSTITVANANKFTAGDEIWVEQRSGVGGTSDRDYTQYGRDSSIRTVSSVSGSTITLTAPIGYNVPAGALVTRLTRRVQVRTTTDSDFGYFYDLHYTSNYNKKRVIKDVYFRRMGMNNGNNGELRGVILRSNTSTNNLPVTLTEQVPSWNQQDWNEGLTLRHSGSTLDWSGLFVQSARYTQIRCAFVCNAKDGLTAPHYVAGACTFNSISANCDRWSARIEGGTEWWEYAYNYHSRARDANLRTIPTYENGIGFHHNYFDASNSYAVQAYNNMRGLPFYKCKFTGYRYGIYNENSLTDSVYCYFEPVPAYARPTLNGTQQAGFFYQQMDRGHNGYSAFNSIEHNFEYDAITQFSYNTERLWDANENAWRVYNRYDNSDYGVGWSESVFVPAGTTVRTRAQIKLAPSYSGNFPRFEARSTQSNIGPNRLGNTGGNWSSFLTGGNTVTQFTSAAQDSYQTRELTIDAVNFPRYIQIGIHVDSSNASEGYWMKEIEIYLDKPYYIPALSCVNSGSGPRYYVGIGIRNTFNQLITRLGGRLN